MRPTLRSLLFCATMAMGASPILAHADAAPPFAQMLREAQSTAPRLAEKEADVRVAQGRADQAGVHPNPTVELQVENLAGSSYAQIIAPVQSTLSASQTLELGGKRSARLAAGRASIQAARASQRQAVADFGYDLAVAYAAAEAAQTRVQLLQQDLERAGEDLRVAKALVQAGREADLRAVQAQAAASATRAELETARAAAVETLDRLSALVGTPTPYTSIGPSLLAQAGTEPTSQAEAPATTFAVAVAEAERDAAAQRVNVERTRGTPDVTVTMGARRIEGLGSTLVVAGISAQLPLFDRNRGNVSAARAEEDAAEARLRTARLESDAAWRSGQFRVTASQATLRAALEGETAAAEAYRLARIGYEAGRSPLSELLSARRAWTDAQVRTLETKLQRIQAEAALARLAGRVPFGA